MATKQFYRLPDGSLLPAVPEPMLNLVWQCECHKNFLRKKSYVKHYIWKHIYNEMKPK